ncbi:MAG: hypothetical protein M5U01_06545 [Ardenticatenaceae bacterium]|nr:hypothetical protein [Ardenticatenaceae bacterium]
MALQLSPCKSDWSSRSVPKTDVVRTLVRRFVSRDFFEYGSPEAADVSQFNLDVEIFVGTGYTHGPDLQIGLWEQLYTLRNPDRVRALVRDHPAVEALLLEARSHIERCFGEDVEIALEVVVDPEDRRERQLVAFIQTDLDPVQALDRLDQLDDEWAVSASRASGGAFLIHLE